MRYRIIITQNGKKKKILYEGNNEDMVKERYYKIRGNNKVLFPKKSNAYKKVKSVTYEILFLKEKEERDGDYFERDDYHETDNIEKNPIEDNINEVIIQPKRLSYSNRNSNDGKSIRINRF